MLYLAKPCAQHLSHLDAKAPPVTSGSGYSIGSSLQKRTLKLNETSTLSMVAYCHGAQLALAS